MGYNQFRYARRIDADQLGIYHEDLTKMLNIDKGTVNTTILEGQEATGKILRLKAAGANAYPYIDLTGNSIIKLVANGQLDINIGATHIMRALSTGSGGSLHIKESTTPSAIATYGAIYTKADNELYFQTGAGVEKTVTTV